MRKSYLSYRKKAVDLSKFALRKHKFKGKIEYAIYCVVSFFAKFIVFLRPLFVIADTNIAIMIEETHDFCIDKAFEGAKQRYGELLIATLKVDLTVIVMLCLVTLPGNYAKYSDIVHDDEFGLTLVTKVLPVVFWAIGYLVAVRIGTTYAATGYIATKGKDLDAGDLLLNSKRGTKGCKAVLWIHWVLNYLFRDGLLFALIRAVIYVYEINEVNSTPLWGFTLFCIGGMFVYAFLYVNIFAPLNLRYEQTKYCIFQDNVPVKRTYVVKQITGESDGITPVFTDEKSEKDILNLNK